MLVENMNRTICTAYIAIPTTTYVHRYLFSYMYQKSCVGNPKSNYRIFIIFQGLRNHLGKLFIILGTNLSSGTDKLYPSPYHITISPITIIATYICSKMGLLFWYLLGLIIYSHYRSVMNKIKMFFFQKNV